MWKITCYNGTEFISDEANIFYAIESFKNKCRLHEMDIKSVVSLH